MLTRTSFNSKFLLQRCTSLNIRKVSLNTSSFNSNQVPAVKTVHENEEKQLKQFETITNVTKKTRIKKSQKPPFVKNFLLGKFDTDILTYPELDKEDTKNLENDVKLVKNLMKQNHMTQAKTLSKKIRQNLADFKAIGLQAAQLMDGKGCNVTESCVYLEAFSENHLRNSILSNEQLGIQALIKAGSDKLKIKYLTKLMNGEILSATCISELGGDMVNFKTKAELSSDGKNWILNGQKIAVVNCNSADICIVFAVSKTIKRDIFTETKITAFLVDKDTPGITVKAIDNKNLDIGEVTFDNVLVPVENVIGKVNTGIDLMKSLLTEYRLSVAPMCVTITKNILNNLINEVRSRSDETNLLSETDNIREIIGKMSVHLYAMESVLYLTTGLIDNYTDQDVEVEALVTKVFCSEETTKHAIAALDLVGLFALPDSHWLQPLFQEAIRFKALHESDDALKIILSLLSLQHAGVTLNEFVDKIRNPLFHVNFQFKRMWRNRRNDSDNPKLDLELGGYLHPSLYAGSQHLEYCIKRLEFAAEVLLVRYGPEVTNYHMDLKRFADAIIDTYVMTACLGRASRSYCIGLQSSDIDIMMCTVFCNDAMERVKRNINKIYGGSYNTNDQNYRHITKKIFKFKEYFLKHPLTRNF